MIKKLRWRFISAAMLAFLLVITLIAGLVNIANYCVETSRIDRTIDSIINYDAYRPQFFGPDMRGGGYRGMAGDMTPMEPFLALPDIEANYMTRFFIVAIDDSNELLFASMDFVASVTESEAIDYTMTALKRNSDRGYIGGYRYARVDMYDGTVVVFLNCEKEIRTMNSVLSMTLVISFFALLLVFVLVVILSRKAIRPIAHNIEIQKRFITDAGHELKTPLTSISTSIDVIEMVNGQDEWTDNIRSQVSRMSGLVSELVALSRLDEVKPVPDKEQFDLSSAAWETLEVFIPQAKAKGKEIKTDISDGISIVGEKTSIQQMFSVLIDNAIKYSDDNGQISFTLSRVRNRVRIEVCNTCNYEKAPDTDRLFDRFYRPDESRNSTTGGNGIGLAIAKAVADAHGGKISAFCPDGKSMKITVEL
jgi:signal transduction histidine kinase